MTLPFDWTESIARSAVSRTDTTGLKTPRDGLTNSQQRIRSQKDEERKALSNQIALESDMISMGYLLNRPEEKRCIVFSVRFLLILNFLKHHLS